MTSNMPGMFHEGNSTEGESAHQTFETNIPKPSWLLVPAGPPERTTTEALGAKWGIPDDGSQGDKRTRSLRLKGKSVLPQQPWLPPGPLVHSSSAEAARKASGTPRNKLLEIGSDGLDRPVKGGDRQDGNPVGNSQGLDRPEESGGN